MSRTITPQDRVIRVFVSSTFRDMQAERDELVLKIFPQLRRLCEERGVTWGEIDLRWGISDEQKADGKVLPICLEEIKRCRPYFIGLLGERYGWIPAAISDEVLRREPWIKSHADGANRKSVTDLEILHGVLNNPEMADHAFFYFRDPTFIERLSADQKKEDFITEDDQSLQKLNSLKGDIRQKHREGKLKYEPRENYPDAKTLGARVLADFTALIEALYPKGQEPSALQRERMDHDAFARSRASIYIGRQEYFDRLDAHVASDAGPLVLLGESGGGKSALLANWAQRYRDQHPNHFLLLHFIGASPDSANAISLLRRIMLELKERFELEDDVPARADKIRDEFPNWLTNVAIRGPIVLVLDALNQLEDVDAAPDLGWLPRAFPKNCVVIVSTLPGRSLTAIEQRGWLQSTLPLLVHPLDEPERRRLIHDFLKQYTRDLGSARTDLVARAPQTANPLYVRVLLNELRVFGRHELLGDGINKYLEAKDPRELYGKVIARWEKTYSEGINLVRDTLSLIWAARRGLSESELLEALGQSGSKVPRAIWSPLFLAMSDALVTRNGLLTFAHDFLRNATRETYLSTEFQQQLMHQQVADYFQGQPLAPRQIDELPWQLKCANAWESLVACLTDIPTFQHLASEKKEYELLGYWVALGTRSDMVACYEAILNEHATNEPDTRKQIELIAQVADFLRVAGRYGSAKCLYLRGLDVATRSGHEHGTGELNWKLGSLEKNIGKLDLASGFFNRAFSNDEPCLPSASTFPPSYEEDRSLRLNWLDVRNEDELDSAVTMYRWYLDLFDPVRGKIVILGAGLASSRAPDKAGTDFDHLMEMHKDFQRQGPQSFLAHSFRFDLATLLTKKAEYAEAEQLFREVLVHKEETKGADHPETARVLNALAGVCTDRRDFDSAERFYRRALVIRETLGPHHPDTAYTLNDLAMMLSIRGNSSEAVQLLRQALTIAELTFGANHSKTTQVRTNLAAVEGRGLRIPQRLFDERGVSNDPEFALSMGVADRRKSQTQANLLSSSELKMCGIPSNLSQRSRRPVENGQLQVFWTIVVLAVMLLVFIVVALMSSKKTADAEDDILQRLRDQEQAGCAFVVIVGASGSGKSSLARAGVAATLTQHPYDDRVKTWRVVTFFPALGASELNLRLTRSLAEQLPELNSSATALNDIANALAKDPALTVKLSVAPAFARADEAANGAVRILLLIDQMEELWTDRRITDEDRERFLNVLEALARSGHIAVLATLRSDFYPHAQRIPAFLRLKGDRGHCDLLAPGAAALQRLITEPAKLAGLQFVREEQTGRRLDQQILQDASRDPSALPLLQYTLSELYQQRDPAKRMLTFAAYEKLGGVEGALGKRAAETFQSLPSDVRAALPEILPLLVTVDVSGEQAAVRRRAQQSELTATPARRALTESLITARFLTTDRDDETPIASLAHEALLRRWEQLAVWVANNREHLRLRARVEQSQHRWASQGKHSSLLIPSGLPLEEGQVLLREARPVLLAQTTDYIERSITHRQAESRRERLIRTTAIVMSLATTLIAVVAALWINTERKAALIAQNIAEHQQAAALRENADNYWRMAVNIRDSKDPDPIRASHLFLRGAHSLSQIVKEQSTEADEAFRRSEAHAAGVVDRSCERTWAHDDAVIGGTFSRDESRVLTWSDDATARLWDVTKPEPLQTFKHESDVHGAQFSRDESRLLTWSIDATARLWDVTKPEPLQIFKHDDRVWGAQFSRDDSRVLTWSVDDTARLWDILDPLAMLTPDERILELEVRSAMTLDANLKLRMLSFAEWQAKVKSQEYRAIEGKLAAQRMAEV